MSNPGKQHWEAVKWILRYLKDSLDTSFCFIRADLKLQGYMDAALAGDINSRKSTTRFVYTLGWYNCVLGLKVVENCCSFHYRS
jgi:hypothetical protein